MGVASNREFTLSASAAKTATFTVAHENLYGRGVKLWVNVTAVTGTTPTLDIKLQGVDPVSEAGFDIPDAAFAQITDATGDQEFILYPGVAATANVSVSDALPLTWQAVCTIGGTTPSFTFSIGGCYIL